MSKNGLDNWFSALIPLVDVDYELVPVEDVEEPVAVWMTVILAPIPGWLRHP